jgi:hypothetical protein
MDRCECPERRDSFFNPEKIPYHWLNWAKGVGFAPYSQRCRMYAGMKESCEKETNPTLRTGSSYGPDGHFEYHLDYLTETERKIRIEKKEELPPSAEASELYETAVHHSS